MAELSVEEIARAVGGRLEGDGSASIRGVAPLQSAGPDQLSFVANTRYLGYLQATRAGAVLVSEEHSESVPREVARVLVDDPHQALYRVLPLLYPERQPEPGVHPTAVVDAAATVAPDASVGPYAVIGAGARIGPRARIGSHAVVGEDAEIGDDSILHPHVTVYRGVRMGSRCVIHSGTRLGRDGFGYVWAEGGHRKIPQVGGCVLGDDVEIGANCNIDRGSIGDTVVGSGTKIDAMVHLGHNVTVGQHAILVAQVGVSGSTAIGDGAVLGGQVGVGGHLTIGAGARVGAQAGVTAAIPAGETYSGYPARPHREALRAQGAVFRLPRLMERVRRLEKAIFGDGRDDRNQTVDTDDTK